MKPTLLRESDETNPTKGIWWNQPYQGNLMKQMLWKKPNESFQRKLMKLTSGNIPNKTKERTLMILTLKRKQMKPSQSKQPYATTGDNTLLKIPTIKKHI